MIASLKRILTSPVDELTRAQFKVRHAIELVFFCGRKMREDRATQIAAALTYRTIFSLVPLTVLALLVFKAFGGFSALGANTQESIYAFLGIDFSERTEHVQQQEHTEQQNTNTATSSGNATQSATNAAQTPDTTSQATNNKPIADAQNETQESVVSFFNELNEQVSQINLAGFGAIGIGVLIWGAISLLVTVERSFNTIYQCPTGRSWLARFSSYWAIITLGPVLLFISFFFFFQALQFATQIPGTKTLFTFLSVFTSLFASWLLLLALFMLMPNTRVAFRPALIGSFVSALLWELAKLGFKLYVTKALSAASLNVALYGSLGLILIFLLWIYITWLVIVFGLEITSTLQLLPGRRLKELLTATEHDPVASPDLILLIMAIIGRQFHLGQSTPGQQLTQTLQLNARTLGHITQLLIDHHLLHQVAEGKSQNNFALARPPQEIFISELLQLGHEQAISRLKSVKMISHQPENKNTAEYDTAQSVPGTAYLQQLIAAQIGAAEKRTLADIISDNA